MSEKPSIIVSYDIKIRKALLFLLYLVIFILSGVILYYLKPLIQFTLTVLSPFIIALIVAYMFNPVVTFLQQKFRLGRIAGVVFTYALILLITAGFFSILLPILYIQAKAGIVNIIQNLPTATDKITTWLSLKVNAEEIAQAKGFLSRHLNIESLSNSAGSAVRQVADQAASTTALITKAVATSIAVVIGFFALVTFVVMICFYFLLDYHRMEYIVRVLLPDDKESRVFAIWEKIDKALGGFLRGQLTVCIIVGVLYSLALLAMGMKQYAVLTGFLAGFGNLIPYLGPVAGGVPAAIWVLFGDVYQTGQEKIIGLGLILGLSILVQSLDGFFLQPRIVGKNAELHPLLVILALLIGAQFGLGGMVIAVPLAVVVRVLTKELWWDELARQEDENKRLAAQKSSATVIKAMPPVVIPPNDIVLAASPVPDEEKGKPQSRNRNRRRKKSHHHPHSKTESGL